MPEQHRERFRCQRACGSVPQLDAQPAPLAAALHAGGRAIHEEAVLEPRMRDLAEPARVVAPSAPAVTLTNVSSEVCCS